MTSSNKKKVKYINKSWVKAARKGRRFFFDRNDIPEISVFSSLLNLFVHLVCKLITLVWITDFDDNLGAPP